MEDCIVYDLRWEKQWNQIVVRTWTDEKFKQRLMADPIAVLTEMGYSPPPGMQVKVVENTDKVVYVPLYAKPPDVELSEEDLLQVSGAKPACNTCSASYWGDAPKR
jgi:nitrile hydratase